MIHRLTLPCEILRDYERRNVFTRFHWGSQHPMMNDISVKISTDEMRILLTDAEDHITVRAAGYPNLAIAYHKFAEKLRAVLRKSGETQSPEIGRDGKSAAAHDYD